MMRLPDRVAALTDPDGAFVIGEVNLETLIADRFVTFFDPDAFDGVGFYDSELTLTHAMRFKDMKAAMECWRLPSTVKPLREDGKPNRPLAALTVEIKAMPK